MIGTESTSAARAHDPSSCVAMYGVTGAVVCTGAHYIALCYEGVSSEGEPLRRVKDDLRPDSGTQNKEPLTLQEVENMLWRDVPSAASGKGLSGVMYTLLGFRGRTDEGGGRCDFESDGKWEPEKEGGSRLCDLESSGKRKPEDDMEEP